MSENWGEVITLTPAGRHGKFWSSKHWARQVSSMEQNHSCPTSKETEWGTASTTTTEVECATTFNFAISSRGGQRSHAPFKEMCSCAASVTRNRASAHLTCSCMSTFITSSFSSFEADWQVMCGLAHADYQRPSASMRINCRQARSI